MHTRHKDEIKRISRLVGLGLVLLGLCQTSRSLVVFGDRVLNVGLNLLGKNSRKLCFIHKLEFCLTPLLVQSTVPRCIFVHVCVL